MTPDQERPPCGLDHGEARSLPASVSAAYTAWVADGRPWKFSRPVRSLGDQLRAHGYTVYYEGDDRHLQKDTPEDHTPFSATGWPVKSPYPYCNATDIMPPKDGQVSKLTGRRLPSLQALGAQLRRDRLDGHPAVQFVKFMNWEPEGDNTGPCYQDSWRPDYARRDSTDRGHIHVSGRSDMHLSAVADGYDLVARTEQNMTIFGWDASHYDATPNAAKVVSEGFAFMTHKAGGDANDAELASWWTAMKPVRGKVLLGAYWVQYPGNPNGRADAFIARLDALCPGWRDGPFILQVDCEKWGGDAGTMPGRADIEAFCDRLVAKAPKLRPIVYAPKWAYGDSLKGLTYPLWASSYVSGSGYASALYPGDTSSRWGAYSGQTPAILQFSSSATIAGQTTCDANAFRGSLAQLTALVAPGWDQDDMTFEADQVPINYPAKDPANPTWSGPNALGATRDLSAETRDRVKALQAATDLGQKAILAAVAGVNEEAVLAAVREEAAKLRQQMADQAKAEQDRDVANIAALLQALGNIQTGSDPVSLDELEQALQRVYGNAFQAAARQVRTSQPDDQDAATAAGRQDAQRRISGSGE
jgi:hypothetical protein